jgi:hypothetical protein
LSCFEGDLLCRECAADYGVFYCLRRWWRGCSSSPPFASCFSSGIPERSGGKVERVTAHSDGLFTSLRGPDITWVRPFLCSVNDVYAHGSVFLSLPGEPTPWPGGAIGQTNAAPSGAAGALAPPPK